MSGRSTLDDRVLDVLVDAHRLHETLPLSAIVSRARPGGHAVERTTRVREALARLRDRGLVECVGQQWRPTTGARP